MDPSSTGGKLYCRSVLPRAHQDTHFANCWVANNCLSQDFSLQKEAAISKVSLGAVYIR